PVIENMHSKNVLSILDYSVEGKETDNQFDLALQKTMQNIKIASTNKSIPFAVFKPTGFGRFKIYQKITEKIELSDEEKADWNKIKERYEKVCKAAYDHNVPLLIDAEESWMQDAADDLIESMMEKYNKEKAIVFGTLQMYRWDRLDYLKALYERAMQKGFYVGMKLVRGAYMEKERERAEEKGYPSPICKDKKETDANFDAAVRFMTENKKMALYCGSHNEESNYYLMQLIAEKNLDKNDPSIWFGQLYGMSDHISFNLAANGYNVTKYLPYGPVRDVMPYLIRRAEENTSVAGQTNRELSLLKTEKLRRKL
ncbi:MAG: proline dehydrogenase family protein, partial [Flavobacteriaceae bacterium]|nr:proline dehydrogenase family protein [Flavobacteriaceae bacterium]